MKIVAKLIFTRISVESKNSFFFSLNETSAIGFVLFFYIHHFGAEINQYYSDLVVTKTFSL